MPILVLLLVVGVVELSVLVLVGHAIGVLPTIGLLVLGAALGSWLMRREGLRAMREFNEAARLRRPPERELADGVLIVAGGVLIMIPGFVSDLAGLLCLLPPTRALLRRRVQRWAERRAERMREQVRTAAAGGFPGAGFPGPRRPDRGDVIDGEVVSVDEHDTPGPRPHPPIGPSTQAEPPRGGTDR